MRQIVILRGISGSGKSTMVGSEFPMAVKVSADDFFMVDGEYRFDPSKLSLAHQACWRAFYAAIQAEAPLIVVDNTNTTVGEISPYVLPAQANGYSVKIITIECDPEVAATRNAHGVSPQVVRGMAQRLEEQTKFIPPYWTHEVIQTS